MSLLIMALSCQSTPSTGQVFTPVSVESAPSALPVADPRFDLEEDTFTITSDEMVANAAPASSSEAAVSEEPELAPAQTAPAPRAVGVPSLSQFPVRVVSTLPQAQPPRAILGLPSGEEVVVAPGSILATEGLVVMSITEGRVQLAKVEPAGDHAKIASFEVSAQYP
jgi:hypothetical protein